MKQAAILSGVILMAIGFVGYFGQWVDSPSPSSDTDVANSVGDDRATDVEDSAPKKPSPTALLPAMFGLVMLICGVVATNEKAKKHAMHLAAGIALIGGLAGLGRGIPGLIKVINAEPGFNSRPVLFIWLMVIVCVAFLILAVRSFLHARRPNNPAS
ncbi:MAG TPA: hypothetical protein PKD64_11985 [Pirellulaceae bacterium]|nr:hypothetical protein [Pirellulaceae bacterium]HMO92905.1 hypothetical protein [Pirellulaceae bacterium]HMP69183.1 hypothetical protein [Pirellulaceae bacterium]